MNRLRTSVCNTNDVLDLRRTCNAVMFLLCGGPSPLCAGACQQRREQVVSYKCAEDRLESTLGLALAAFQAHPLPLIMANKGSELTRCCTLALRLEAAAFEGDFFH